MEPDMTTLGKIAGDGFRWNFRRPQESWKRSRRRAARYNSGTYKRKSMSLAAGLATVEYLDKQRFHLKINEMGNTLRSALAELQMAGRSWTIPCPA